MSWLRDHFHNFVFPAFVAAEKKSSEIGEAFDVRPSLHAPERLPSELRKLWTLCKEHEVPWEYDVREINLHGGASKYREKARVDHEVLNTTLDSAMAALRHEGCDRLFLGGRDVWAFAVMCERRRIPYMFTPELSRYVAGRPETRAFLEERGFTGRELFLDTGYAGSIPRSLAAHFPGRQFKFRLMSQTAQFVHTPAQEGGVFDSDTHPHRVHKAEKKERWKRYPNQLFPNRKTARDEAMFQEYVAKYWRGGTFSEPMLRPPIGHAKEVFKTWLHKPGVWRYDDAKHRVICMTDGKEAISVGLNDLKIAPGLYEWWKSLPKGPAWVPPDHKMGQIVQFFSDKRSIQRAALLTSQLWRGIPHWKAMTVEKPVPVLNKYFDGKLGTPVLNPAGISNLTFADSAATSITTNSAATSVITYTSNATGTWNVMPPGLAMALSDGEKGPILEITKAQLNLFEGFPKIPLAEGPQLLLPLHEIPPMVSEMPEVQEPQQAKMYIFPNIMEAGCTCGPEEACQNCHPDKPMTFTQFQSIAT